MRLLLVTPDFPPDVGGTQTYALELARRLHARCDDFAVMAPSRGGAAAADAALPFEVIRPRASGDAFALASLRRMFALRRRFDTTFHVLWPTALAALTLRRFGWKGRVFVSAHARELLIDPAPFRLLRKLYGQLRRIAITRADGVFPVSRYTADLLGALGAISERVVIVGNGTDPAHFYPNGHSTPEAVPALGGRVVLTVSRLTMRKGIDTVIRALPGVARAVSDVSYVVAGSGPDESRLRRLAQSEGVADRVHFIGRVDYASLPDYYNACDVFAMPALDMHPDVEGFGIVFLEANACAKPVIGARSGGIPDAIRHEETGLLVEPGDATATAEALIRLLTDRDLAARLGRQGRARVLAEATWDHSADQLYGAMQPTLN